jgi:CheY-like chemotaxis protein
VRVIGQTTAVGSNKGESLQPATAVRPRTGGSGRGASRASAGAWRERLLGRAEPESGGAPSSPATRILVVDDESAIRTICRINLEAAGMAVSEAGDGAEALRVARREPPSLVLLDVMMPLVDGWRVAAELAADPATSEVPIVFLSARAGAEDRRQARLAGAIGYIVKPFDPLVLGETLATLLDRYERGERERLRDELVDEL